MQSTKIKSIQAIRGIAALSVVFFHCKSVLTGDDSLKNTVDWLFNSGAAGVDVFFIISGFIMVVSTHTTSVPFKIINPLNFLLKRFLRVWPPYAIVTILFLLFLYKFNVFTNIYIKICFKKYSFYTH